MISVLHSTQPRLMVGYLRSMDDVREEAARLAVVAICWLKSGRGREPGGRVRVGRHAKQTFSGAQTGPDRVFGWVQGRRKSRILPEEKLVPFCAEVDGICLLCLHIDSFGLFQLIIVWQFKSVLIIL